MNVVPAVGHRRRGLPRAWTAERTWAAVEEKYRALFEQMDEAYAVVEVLADAAG